jgi:hypothetical protein
MVAADYDQSCASNADCAAVYQGSLCTECLCPTAAINQQALSAYSNAIEAAGPPVGVCNCPAFPPPVCQAGTCVLP